MKTTLDLPDELMRTIKLRAVLRRGLAQEPTEETAVRKRVRLPLVECAHRAGASEEMAPERVAQLLLDEDARAAG